MCPSPHARRRSNEIDWGWLQNGWKRRALWVRAGITGGQGARPSTRARKNHFDGVAACLGLQADRREVGAPGNFGAQIRERDPGGIKPRGCQPLDFLRGERPGINAKIAQISLEIIPRNIVPLGNFADRGRAVRSLIKRRRVGGDQPAVHPNALFLAVIFARTLIIETNS